MAKQTVNIGTVANDGTGDPLRTAFDKLNDNFDEVYGNSFVEEDRIAAGAVTISKIADAAKVTEAEGISSNDNDTTLPTSAAVKDYVDTEIAGLIDAAPAALDTLNELAAALGDDANFATTVTNSIATKQDTLTAGDITFSLLDPAAIVTEAEGIASNDNDTTIPTSAAVYDLVTSQSHTNTTYTVSAADGDNADEEKIVLTGSDASTDTVILEAGSNLSISRTGDKITFANSAPDQTVTLTQGSNVTITGSYPNFTIASTDTNTQLSTEQVQDIVGAMVSGNTESNITVTYNDTTGKLDFTANAGDITGVTAGSGLSGGGTSGTVTLNHADTSSAANLTASGRTYVTGLTFDTYGHVTGYTTGTETVTDTNTTYSAGAGLDLSGTTFSVESDLRGDVVYIGQDTNDYIHVNTTVIDFRLDGNLDMRLENDGDLHVDGDVIAYSTTTSDRRLKDNIKTIDSALEKVEKLRGVEYDWNATSRKGQHDMGVIAQEIEEVFPFLVREKELQTGEFADNPQTFKTVDYEKLVGVLIESVKELSAEVKELKSKI